MRDWPEVKYCSNEQYLNNRLAVEPLTLEVLHEGKSRIPIVINFEPEARKDRDHSGVVELSLGNYLSDAPDVGELEAIRSQPEAQP